MRISIVGYNLPGRLACGPDGSPISNVHVGVQLRRDPTQLKKADAVEVSWDVDIEVVKRDRHVDFHGPAVQGKRGDRFIYLTWGNVDTEGAFEMFRRAKLMLNRIDANEMQAALAADRLVARVDLTGDDGGPRCARVDPPAIKWSTPDL